LLVDRLDAEVGAVVALEPIVFLHKQEGDEAGRSDADGSRMAATVVSHRRGKKLRVFKYKPKKRYRRTIGYRSDLTELRIESLVARGDALPKPAPRKSAPTKPGPDTPAASGKASAAKASAGTEGKTESAASKDAAGAAAPAKTTAKAAKATGAPATKPARKSPPKPTTSEDKDDGA